MRWISATQEPEGEMSELVDYKGYPCKSRKLKGSLGAGMVPVDAWFYEDADGLHVLIDPKGKPGVTSTKIPWRKVCAAVDQHRRIRKKIK